MPDPAVPSPGHTAVLAAVGRAIHLDSGPPTLVADTLALDLAGAPGAEILGGLKQMATPEGLANLGLTFAIRARVVEDEVERAASSGVRQYVILGAGLDSFAHRRTGLAAGVRVFEVDRPESQSWKRARLTELGMAEPPDTIYVPVDFDRGGLIEGLQHAGFDHASRAIVSWMAVINYLDSEAIDDTLAIVGSLPAGSPLVMTYVVPPSELTELEQAGLAWTMSQAAERGEPFLTLLRPRDAEALLRRHGFTDVELYGPRELRHRYLPGATHLRLPGIERLVVATR